MGLKSSEWLMLAVVAAAIVMFLIWVILPNTGVSEFIETKSIQIPESAGVFRGFR